MSNELLAHDIKRRAGKLDGISPCVGVARFFGT